MSIDNKQDFKKSFINYIDILIAVINSFVILSTLIILHENIILSIIGVFFSGVVLILTIFTFKKNNPLYLYYFYIILFYGILFLIPLTIINLPFGALMIPEIIYMIYLISGKSYTSAISSYAKARFLSRAGVRYGLNAGRLARQWDSINQDLEIERLKHKEIIEKQYHAKKIMTISLILSVSLFVVFILFIISNIHFLYEPI